MSKKNRSRGPFNKHHEKQAQALLKSERQYVYHIYWPLWKQLSWKKSLLVICNILGLFVNILTADDKYSLLDRDNLTQPTQMQLSYRQKTFSKLFSPFLKYRLSFEDLQEKDDPHSWCIFEITDFTKRGYINVRKVSFQRTLRQAT